MSEQLSPKLKQFIQSTINSVEQLEVLLFLMSNTAEPWTAEQISARTRMPAESISDKLRLLHREGLLELEQSDAPRYRYLPNSSALSVGIEESLKRAYLERKDTVIQLIYSRPLDNIRILADAFRISNPPEDEE